MKKNVYDKIVILCAVGIFIMTGYIKVSSSITKTMQNNTIKTYTSAINSSTQVDYQELYDEALQYNSILYQTKGMTVGNSAQTLSDENYNKLLNLNNDGIMGTIEIPKINVNLPIYHGTEDEVLEVGIGHLQESSLPVGGENSRAVLTGHRGLPNSKLFTRIDELVKGDFFFIKVFDKTLAYQVTDIEVILPEELDALNIIPEKDLVSLVTCTPYAINTHRLIVTGERVEYSEQDKETIKKSTPSLREIILTSIINLFFFGSAIMIIRQIYSFIKGQTKKKGGNKSEAKKD